MFAYNRFFRGLRLVLALRRIDAFDDSDIALGEVAIDGIKNLILPGLEDRLLYETDEGKRRELQQVIEIWEKYANRNTSQGRSWNKEAVKVVTAIARQFGVTNEQDVVDFGNEIASHFFAEPRLRTLLGRFKIEGGPLDLMKFFKRTVRDVGYDIMRSALRRYERNVSLQTPTETEDRKEMGESFEDPRQTGTGRDILQDFYVNMKRFVMRKLKGTSAELLFQLWLDVATKEGPENVNFSRDILPEWEEATGFKKSRMTEVWDEVRSTIVSFFESEGIPLPLKKMRKFKLAHSVAQRFMWASFSKWMLQPYLVTRGRC